MFLRDKVIMVSGWCYLLTVLTSILMLTSCVPTTFDNTGLVVPPDQEYADIQKTATTLSTTDELATADILIGKSESFISMYPKYKHVDEVYYILGITLVQYDRTEEGIAVLDELIRYYPLAPSVEKSMFTLGLAYDKINKHDKADAVYGKLVNSPKFGNGKYAMNAQKLLTTDKADRKGALEGLANLEDGSKPTNFVGQKALDFQVTDLKGQSLSLAQYRGKVVLLDFWATWCGPCIAEMPNVKRTYAKYKNQNFEIIGISLDRGQASLESYVEREGLTWPQYYDSSRRVSNMYQVRSIPSTFLIDGSGVIRMTNLRGSALESAVAQLVQENMAR